MASLNITTNLADVAETANDAVVLFGIYCIYFVGFVFICLLLDRSTCLDFLVDNLGALAHKSFLTHERVYMRKKGGKNSERPKDDKGSCCKKASIKVAPEELSQTESQKAAENKKKGCCRCLCAILCAPCNCCQYFLCGSDDCEEYNPLFVKKLLAKSPYFGIPSGKVCCLCCSGPMMADFIFYLMNHHTVLSMVAASKQNSFSRGERKIAFYVQHCMAFFFASLVIYAELGVLQRLMINIFVITPITLVINTAYYYMLACPCLIHEWEWAISKWCAEMLDSIGKCIAYPLGIVSFGFLLLAAAFNVAGDGDQLSAVVQYSYQVHLVSIFVDFFMALVLFKKNTYTVYKVCGIPIFKTGVWFKEQMDIFELVEGEDYTVEECCCCPGLFAIQTCRRKPGVECPKPTKDVEMGALSSEPIDSPTAAPAADQPPVGYTPIGESSRNVDAPPAAQAYVPGGAMPASAVGYGGVSLVPETEEDAKAIEASAAAAESTPAADAKPTPAPEAAAPAPGADANPTPAPEAAAPAPGADAKPTPAPEAAAPAPGADVKPTPAPEAAATDATSSA